MIGFFLPLAMIGVFFIIARCMGSYNDAHPESAKYRIDIFDLAHMECVDANKPMKISLLPDDEDELRWVE